ncbi:hypothetical protein KR093_004712, partial [Drosophila rubida]
RTYADVHSSGLASRIVKYHNDSTGGTLKRSISFNNLHQPITQPRRSIVASPLTHKPNLPLLSMTRIAPPERSFYCGNTLPSLLRSNSLLGVDKCSEQLSCENRPILHPQPLQHDNEPTRSVLEELKEISRKRINSSVSQRLFGAGSMGLTNNKCFQDIQQNEFNTKKSCNRMADFVDHHNMHPHPQPHIQQMQSPTGVKRHRELSVAVPLRLHHTPIVVPLQHHHQPPQQHQLSHHQLHQQQQQQQNQLHMTYGGNNNHSPQQSPEQVAKRRNCSYSNDISSSLSSSKLHSHKRKLYDMREKVRSESGIQSTVRRENSASPDNSPLQHAAKIQRRQPTSDLRLAHLTQSQSTPITPLPATPAQRTVSAPALQQSATREEAVATPKPKLTLFNAKQQQLKQQVRTLEAESPDADVDAGEYAGIHFVKPKQQNSFNGVKNSNLERTQKTKLALMLSSLKGEIYQDDSEPESEARLVDETDAKRQPRITGSATLSATTKTTTVPTTTVTLSSATITTATVATAAPLATITTPAVATTAAVASTTTIAATVTTTAAATIPNANTKPVILGMTTIAPASNLTVTSSTEAKPNNSFNLISFNNTPTTKQTPTTSSSEVSTKLNATASEPILGGFKLPSSTTNTTNTANAALLFASPKATTASAQTTSTTSAGVFSFGNTATAKTTSASTSSVSTTAAITAPTFSFGGAATLAAPAATPAAAAANVVPAASSIFAFGNAAAAKTSDAPSTTNAATTFSFGNATSNTAPPAFKMDNWTPKPSLAAAASSTQSLDSAFKAPMATTTPTAAPTNAQNNTTDSSKVFSFGNSNTKTTSANAAAPIAPTATSIFGQAAAATATPSTPSFSFNSATTSATTTTAQPVDSGSNSSAGLFAFAGSGGASGATAAGGAAAVVKPVAKAPPFTLPSTNKSNVFSFGGGGGNAAKTPATAAAPTNFNFNATPNAPAAASTNNFSFNAAPNQTSIFGGNATESATATITPSKPLTFGGNATTTEQQSQSTAAPAAPAGGFSFAAVAQKNESNNLFGTPAATGVVKPSFNFGGNSAPSTTTPAPAAFGGFATPAAPASKPFAFGGSATSAPANNTTSPMGSNLFASAVTATQQQQQQPQQQKPFAFGGAAATPQMNSTSNIFAFGANSSTAPANNIFGSAAPAPVAGGTFKFGGTASPAPGNGPTPDMQGGATAQQLNSGNLFALPNTPESRPIRRATRRLQK